jgi:hypothetical protein
MATTTNYGWTTPNDTDLVKDGAAAIRTLGSSVDTTTKALNPSTTLGDVEYRSATANTNTRLPIGTTGQVLTVTGGVPAWETISAGGMTLLSTTTLSGASTTISSISGSYTDLQIVIQDAFNATDAQETYIRFNSDTGSNYINWGYSRTTSSILNGAEGPTDRTQIGWSTTSTSNSDKLTGIITISNYISTGSKSFTYVAGSKSNAGDLRYRGGIGKYIGGSAISSFTLYPFTGNWSGGTVLIYGVK